MKKTNWLLISTLGTLAGVSIAAAHHGGPGLFEKLDTNKDGVVTSQEVEAAAQKHFAELDTNKDGKVTPEERKAAHERRKSAHFEDRDKNDNGVLDRNEVERMPDELFNRLDADKSGTLSYEEMANFGPKHGHKGPRGDRAPGDRAGDTVLTKADFVAKAKERMQKLDANNDGKITQDEAKAFRGTHGRGGPGKDQARGEPKAR